MKVALLSSAPQGGAGIAAKRLSEALNSLAGVSCDFIDIALLGEVPSAVAFKGSASNRKISDTHFTAEHPGFVRQWVVNLLSGYEVINVHWASFLITTSEIDALAAMGKTVVMTMHDFYYSTGGCHYQAGCRRQELDCVGCPQVDTARFSQSAVQVACREKKRLLARENVSITAPSAHVRDAVLRAGLSSKTRAFVLRNSFLPVSDVSYGSNERSSFNVVLIADSLSERRKGMVCAIEAAQLAASHMGGRLKVVVIGRAGTELRELCRQKQLEAVFVGHVSCPSEIEAYYRAADVLLTCSTEDNWPNVLVEAGAYGVAPVVGPGHGCEEFARLYGFDFIAESYSPQSFAKQLLRAAESARELEGRISSFSTAVRRDHHPMTIAEAFVQVFRRH